MNDFESCRRRRALREQAASPPPRASSAGTPPPRSLSALVTPINRPLELTRPQAECSPPPAIPGDRSQRGSPMRRQQAQRLSALIDELEDRVPRRARGARPRRPPPQLSDLATERGAADHSRARRRRQRERAGDHRRGSKRRAAHGSPRCGELARGAGPNARRAPRLPPHLGAGLTRRVAPIGGIHPRGYKTANRQRDV